MDGQTDGRTEGWMDRQMYRWMNGHRQMYRWRDGHRQMYRWRDGRTNGKMKQRRDDLMNRRMDGEIDGNKGKRQPI